MTTSGTCPVHHLAYPCRVCTSTPVPPRLSTAVPWPTYIRDRLIAYIESMEASHCAEYHLDGWPECDDMDYGTAHHAEGRTLLALLKRP